MNLSSVTVCTAVTACSWRTTSTDTTAESAQGPMSTRRKEHRNELKMMLEADYSIRHLTYVRLVTNDLLNIIYSSIENFVMLSCRYMMLS